MLLDMAHDGWLVGELARKAGTTRKALRLYEAAGLLAPARPCRHVHELVRRKAADVERALVELSEVRKTLLGLLRSWPSLQRGPAAVCRHIESFNGSQSAREVGKQWRNTSV